jgi:uncharacterized integral membrane protein
MRWLYLTIVCLLGVITLVFAFENMEIVSMDFLWFSLRLPLALLVIVIYILGMVTGSNLQAFIRWSVRGARLKA